MSLKERTTSEPKPKKMRITSPQKRNMFNMILQTPYTQELSSYKCGEKEKEKEKELCALQNWAITYINNWRTEVLRNEQSDQNDQDDEKKQDEKNKQDDQDDQDDQDEQDEQDEKSRWLTDLSLTEEDRRILTPRLIFQKLKDQGDGSIINYIYSYKKIINTIFSYNS